MRCGLARCPGAKSTRFSVILVVSFSHVHAISSRLQCNCADLPSGCWVPTLPTQYAGYQRIKSTYSWTSKNSWTPFFLGGGWSWRWCWFPLHWLELGFRIIYKYPSFITSNYRIQQILFILNALQKSKHNSLRRSFVHLTTLLEPFLHKQFSCSILLLQFVERFPCPDWLPQLLLEHPNFGF